MLFFIRGEMFTGHGVFPLRAHAVRWAERERLTFEQETSEPLDDMRC